MKKPIQLLLLVPIFFISFYTYAQTGVAGVGSNVNTALWLDASKLGLLNNSSLNSWTDLSTNLNHAFQANTTFQPIFKTNQLNGHPAIQFDGINDRLTFNSNITTSGVTAFIVANVTKSTYSSILATENHHFAFSSVKIQSEYQSKNNAINKSINSFSISSFSTGSNSASGTIQLTNGSNTLSQSRNAFFSIPQSSMGSLNYFGNFRFFLEGLISEVVVFNEEINSAQRKIVGAYLGAKYNLTPEQSLFAYGSTHGSEVFGIGQESDGANTTAQGTGIVEISNASALGNGDYLLIGHDNGGLSTTSSVGSAYASNRFNQTWRADVTNTPGTIDIKFFLTGNNFAVDPANDYRLLIDNTTGAFDNSSVSQSLTGTYNAIDETITFTGVALTDGDYITLAVRPNVITAVGDGAWNTPATWSCTCVPTSTDNVVIPSPRVVDVDGATATAEGLTIDAGATLNFNSNDSLLLNGDLLVNGSISSSTGLLGFVGTGAQELWNNSGSAITQFDFYANNSTTVSFKSGDWNITNFIKVAAGQLVNDGATVTLVSDASTQAQIQPSATNSFSGEFILQRYFSARNANYADITAPVVSTTIADWDAELFMSGVGGNDGDARDGAGGPIYYSVTKYNNTTKAYIYITSTAETIVAGEGVELFLGDNLSTFGAQTMDHRGTPYTGPISITLKPGFNLIANPYSCFINYSSVTKPSGVNNQFYVYVQNSGAYQLFTGGFIAAHQGFWVNNTSGSDKVITFNESNKFPLAISLISKQKKENKFALAISSLGNGFGNELSVMPSATAENGLDTEDEYYLASPHKATTALTTQPFNSNVKLIGSAINTMDDSQTIPLTFKAGENGSYAIEAKDVSELLAIYGCVLLEDKVEGKVIDLNSTSTYTFASTIGEYNRFNLHLFKSAEDCQELLNKATQSSQLTNGISIVKRGQIVELNYAVEEAQQAQVDIYNLNGQKVAATQYIGINGNGSKELDFTTELNGIHLIVVRTNNEVITEKFNF